LLKLFNYHGGEIGVFRVRLKSLRESSGYRSQQSFADVFGVAQSTVAGWEGGKREPNFATTIRLADFFGVSIDYLLGHEKEETAILDTEDGRLVAEDEFLLYAYHNATDEDREIIDNIVGRYIPSQGQLQIG
jgi:transcriptional regulator with XRE-family HTH domain